jgi:hypothetical protein
MKTTYIISLIIKKKTDLMQWSFNIYFALDLCGSRFTFEIGHECFTTYEYLKI